MILALLALAPSAAAQIENSSDGRTLDLARIHYAYPTPDPQPLHANETITFALQVGNASDGALDTPPPARLLLALAGEGAQTHLRAQGSRDHHGEHHVPPSWQLHCEPHPRDAARATLGGDVLRGLPRTFRDTPYRFEPVDPAADLTVNVSL